MSTSGYTFNAVHNFLSYTHADMQIMTKFRRTASATVFELVDHQTTVQQDKNRPSRMTRDYDAFIGNDSGDSQI